MYLVYRKGDIISVSEWKYIVTITMYVVLK
jgi:hypothetical protein